MKNLYALNTSNKLVHINEVDKTQKEKFRCCNCGNELIARKGKIKSHHFSHKQQLDCNYESYLHKLGKLKFHKEYSEALEQGKPFLFQYTTIKTCNSCLNSYNLNLKCKLDSSYDYYDLTTRFDRIAFEKKYNGFIADILLESSKTEDKILIEIAVTHKCEQGKINSGLRIIEINVTEENDLNFLAKKRIKLNLEHVERYNFKINHLIEPFHKKENCEIPHKVFIVFKNGKAIYLKNTKISKIINGIRNNNYLYYNLIRYEDEFDYEGDTFIDETRNASNRGINVRNCWACRFAAVNERYDQEYPLWCKRLKTEIPNSNNGVDCNKFWRIEKPAHNNG